MNCVLGKGGFKVRILRAERDNMNHINIAS